MNEEEKQAIFEIEKLTAEIYTYMDMEKTRFYRSKYKIILDLIEKQQKEIEKRLKEIDSLYKMMSAKDDEIEELKEDNNALEMMIDTANEREYRKKYIEERRKEQPNLYCPDFDEIYERYYKQKAEIEQMKKDYQILKDDIEGHRIAYVDTPEFEENYINKDKIKEIREEYKKERSNMTKIIFSKYGKTQQTFNQAVVNEVIKVLDEILGE